MFNPIGEPNHSTIDVSFTKPSIQEEQSQGTQVHCKHFEEAQHGQGCAMVGVGILEKYQTC
jgi:hypothetical protein